jgi:threonine synthase
MVDLHGKRVVCVLTGHGLKDPDTAIKGIAAPIMIEANITALLKVI